MLLRPLIKAPSLPTWHFNKKRLLWNIHNSNQHLSWEIQQMCLTGKHLRPSGAPRNSRVYWRQREWKWTEYKVTDVSGWIWSDSDFWKTLQLTTSRVVQALLTVSPSKSYRTVLGIDTSNQTCCWKGSSCPSFISLCPRLWSLPVFSPSFSLPWKSLRSAPPDFEVTWVRWLPSI